jgi:aspartate-semialdehyde dehydrogenase
MDRVKVGVLGATGMVGQRFIQLLAGHPWFRLTEVAASEKSAGKTYAEAMEGRWKLNTGIPAEVRGMKVKECVPGLDCQVVFSALDADVAGPIEQAFARAGYVVSSNSKNHRMEPDVPLLIPEVNARRKRNWKGFIVTNPNCSTIHMVLVLKPLMQFGLSRVMVVTMQALSGAGYPGVASLDILDNVIPFIRGEEEKVETETLKLLGSLKGGVVEPAPLRVSAHCNRVNVNDGHTECVSVKLDSRPGLQELLRAFREFNPLGGLGLPSAPPRPLVVREEADRPQPKMDRDLERGMASVVGRVRECSVLDYKFVLLGHNTIRGAAGAAILNAELMRSKGYI